MANTAWPDCTVWPGTDDKKIAEKMLAMIPKDFDGSLLDIPSGTNVFTASCRAKLSNAKITCMDCSEEMLEKGKKRLKEAAHVTFENGDVTSLKQKDNTYDIVFSMNGFHVFAQKGKAFAETYRVLKPKGKFIACFYIRDQVKITDLLVETVLSPCGWFTPPFLTKQRVMDILCLHFNNIDVHTDGSLIYFQGQKI